MKRFSPKNQAVADTLTLSGNGSCLAVGFTCRQSRCYVGDVANPSQEPLRLSPRPMYTTLPLSDPASPPPRPLPPPDANID